MNSCILMAEIYDAPQLRHTPDGMEVTEMIVTVPGSKPEDPTHPLKVVAWKNLAKEVHENYHCGDRVIIEGRLGMNTIERPEGFKEKRAELTAQKIHPIGGTFQSDNVTPITTSTPPPPPAKIPVAVTPVVKPQPASFEGEEPDPHDIPF